VQQQLIRHANRCYKYVGGRLAEQDDDRVMLGATHNLGNLYANQGKLDEAEDMYR
jgi:hypothetical protein